MSVNVIVHRHPCLIGGDGSPGDACRPAPPHASALISNDQVAIAHGRAALDAEGYQWQPVNGSIPADANMIPGELIEKRDLDGTYMAQLTSITYTVEISENGREFTATAALSLRRVADE